MSEVFDKYWKEYDDWYEKHKFVYLSEVEAIKRLLPIYANASGLEIGVGTGRFATFLNIKLGIEPSKTMAQLARKRGVKVIEAVAEDIPFNDESFDICFSVEVIERLNNPQNIINEAQRVLKPGGMLFLITPNVHSIAQKLRFLFSDEIYWFRDKDHKGLGHTHPIFDWLL